MRKLFFIIIMALISLNSCKEIKNDFKREGEEITNQFKENWENDKSQFKENWEKSKDELGENLKNGGGKITVQQQILKSFRSDPESWSLINSDEYSERVFRKEKIVISITIDKTDMEPLGDPFMGVKILNPVKYEILEFSDYETKEICKALEKYEDKKLEEELDFEKKESEKIKYDNLGL